MRVYLGYTIVNAKDELDIQCTDDMSIDDHCMSGRVWLDRELAQAALDHQNNSFGYAHAERPFKLADVAIVVREKGET
jgi:hypothetical protein